MTDRDETITGEEDLDSETITEVATAGEVSEIITTIEAAAVAAVVTTILIDLIKTAEDLEVVGNHLALEGDVLEITLAEVEAEAVVAVAEYVFNFKKDIARLETNADTCMKRVERSKNKDFPKKGFFFEANLGGASKLSSHALFQSGFFTYICFLFSLSLFKFTR